MGDYCEDGFDGIAPERCPYCGKLPQPQPEPIGDIVDRVMEELKERHA